MDFSPLKTCYHCGKLFETKNDDNDSDADFDEFNVNNFITMIVIIMIMKMRSKVVMRMLKKKMVEGRREMMRTMM